MGRRIDFHDKADFVIQVLYKYPVSQYPVVDEIAAAIDPFFKLFNVVVKWQRAEKKWTDGAFLDLNSEVIEAEVDEYWRELYKIQKFFNNKFKKMQVRLMTLTLSSTHGLQNVAMGRAQEEVVSTVLWQRNTLSAMQ